MEHSIAPQRKRIALGLFERYLTLWVALCIVAGIALGSCVPAPFHALGAMSVANVNLPVAVLIWLMIVPMLLRVDFGAIGTVATHWRGILVTLGDQLAGQAVLHGAAGLDVHSLAVRRLSAGGPDRQLHRRADPAGGRALHGDGVRLVEPVGRRAELHPEPGRAERRDHDRRLRADRRLAARAVGDQRALGHAVPVGGAVYRGAGDRRAGLAPGSAGAGRRRGAGDGFCAGCIRFR